MSESLEVSDVFAYITTEENSWKTTPIPLTNSKDWSMYEHIQRCKNVANAWYHSGKNDGNRPYNDIVTPIIDVAFRLEGFDAKDIVPFVNSPKDYYKSFLIKKYHPKWARKNELDTFIDELVETSIIYDLALVKNINDKRPEVVDLTTIAFCDQSDVMAGPICLKHNYTPAEISTYRDKWDSEAIDLAIIDAKQSKKVKAANDQTAKMPSKYIEVYELRGNLPESWLEEGGDPFKYVPQMHLVCYYTDGNGQKAGLTLYNGVDEPLDKNFKALKIDTVRSKGRACGRSIVERLFEPQVWNNYSGIKIKELLDSAINIIVTDSEELGNKKLTELKQNAVVKQEKGASTSRLDGTLQNLPAFQTHQQSQEIQARALGSASEAALGRNPTSGTPFALEALVVQEGQGIHEYRQGKIATFFADVLYRDWILQYLVDDMNKGITFSEELTMEEMNEVGEAIARNEVEQEIKEMILDGKIPSPDIREQLIQTKLELFKQGGSRKFIKVMQNELKDLPLDVMVNIKGKQKRMIENADKITKVIQAILANPGAIAQVPGVSSAFNQLLEESGMSPIDFHAVTKAVPAPVEEPLPVVA